jgi:hypothetical protein
MSGSASERVAVVTASGRSLPDVMYSIVAGMVLKITCTCPPSISVSAGASPRVVSIRDAVSALNRQVVWLARTNVTSGEIGALHHDINRVQQGFADLEARVEVIEQAQR